MSYLPDFLLHELCEKHALIDPYDPALVNPASVDLRLGREFVNLSELMIEYAVEGQLGGDDEVGLYPYLARPGARFTADRVSLRPGVALLATTAERVSIPDSEIKFEWAERYWSDDGWEILDEMVKVVPALVADVKLKSSAARSGLDHALAGWVDPGFGCGETEYPPGSGQMIRGSSLTLEFHAHRPVELIAGKCYVQLCVSTMLAAPRKGYQQTGRYVGLAGIGAVESKGVK